ncbi:MAG: retroviral-like aspartic protease family protein [Planctomycetaceae bacterium]|nr:retroviral-like aspartic protease family protein [Planctomycetaceae bacterium]
MSKISNNPPEFATIAGDAGMPIIDCFHVRLTAIFVSLFMFFCCGSVSAQGDPETVLQQRGLRKSSAGWILEEESELTKLMSQSSRLKRQVSDAGRVLTQAERQALAKKTALTQMNVQHVQLNAQLANARTVAENNRIVGLLNALGGQINLASQDQTAENNLKAARSKAGEVRELYAQHIIDMRTRFDVVKDRYTVLAADNVVRQAINDFNQSSDKKLELGPSRSLASFERSLVKLEETVLSEDIQGQQGQGSLLYVAAVINGKEPIDIAVDTGASVVVLSWELAEKLDLKPGPDAQRVSFVVADGRQIEGRMVSAKTVRVGRFTVEDVECAVFGPENTNVVPLLGQSFLEHFIYRIDSGKGIISMTRVEDESASKSKSRGREED